MRVWRIGKARPEKWEKRGAASRENMGQCAAVKPRKKRLLSNRTKPDFLMRVILPRLLCLPPAAFAAGSLLDENFWETADTADVAAALDAGAAVGARDKYGATPLHSAAAFSKAPAAVELLIDRGADVDARDTGGGTPLHSATANSETPAVVELLIDHSADVSAQSKDGTTPLH